MTFALPRTVTLPSGRRLTVRAREAGEGGEGLFADAIAAADLVEDGRAVDVRDLALADFHVVRALLAKARAIDEAPVEVACSNCDEVLRDVRPCAGLETGPYEDGELDDEELDALLETGVPHAIPPIFLGRARLARSVTFAPRTVREAAALHRALAAYDLAIDEALVAAMGIVALGPLRDPARIAKALAACDDPGGVTDAFLETHYPLRLACDVFCPACKARNTVDAPYDREFELSALAPAGGEPLPPLEAFVERAHRLGDPLLPDGPVELVVSDDTPAVDDGGEPLLGSFEPPPPEGALLPTRPPTITIYYRTFQAAARDDVGFDWEAELLETIEHELEHHGYWARGGSDPMDEEERAAIAREAVRVIGRGEATRRTFAAFGISLGDFARRAWPLVAIAFAVLALTIAEGRCAGSGD